MPDYMLLLGTFGVEIGSVRFLLLGCLTLLHAPIFAPHCPDATRFMNRRSVGLMMNASVKLREYAFHHWCLLLLVTWDLPLLSLVTWDLPLLSLGNLLPC